MFQNKFASGRLTSTGSACIFLLNFFLHVTWY